MQAPEPAATPDGVPSTLAVAFDGAGCLAKGLPEGVDWPFFAPGEEPPTDATLAGTFTRVRAAAECRCWSLHAHTGAASLCRPT